MQYYLRLQYMSNLKGFSDFEGYGDTLVENGWEYSFQGVPHACILIHMRCTKLACLLVHDAKVECLI